MAFIIDKQELRRGLIIFRRGDLQHREWYCRVKMPQMKRYKTVALKTLDIESARERAQDHFSDVRAKVNNGIPVFNRPFRDVAQEYLATQIARATRGEVSKARPDKMKAIIEGPLATYCGSTQVHLIGDEMWGGYPAWRRETGEGRSGRNGGRKVTSELATKLVAQDQAMIQKGRIARGLRPKPLSPEEFEEAVAAKLKHDVTFISDATIRFEMSIFASIMQYAIKKRYIPASQRFDDRPKLKKMRRDEFTKEEYTTLYKFARDKWIKSTPKDAQGKAKPGAVPKDLQIWYRTVTHNFVLVMCNTGMRPSEAKNLRWRDITTAKDGEGRDLAVLFVQGKGKSRKLVAPDSVSKYLNRIREISKATGPEDRVFTTIDGTPAKSLYKALIDDLLTKAGLRVGPCGTIRSTYSFRHTYATMRLSAGVDVYFLAEQMGTSVKMIEDHYGHVNTIKHADRVLTGIGGWEAMNIALEAPAETEEADAKARQAVKTKQFEKKPPSKR